MFADGTLDNYRAVVFLDTGASSGLSDAQRAAFERYYGRGGGFLGIGSAIETDPSWQFLSDVLGTRPAHPATGGLDDRSARSTSPTSVHEASKDLPEYWDHQDVYYNYTSQRPRLLARARDRRRGSVRARSPRAAGSRASAGGTMGSDHPVLWCKDYKGGRSFYSGSATRRRASQGRPHG